MADGSKTTSLYTSVTTDLSDYAPDSTAEITATGFTPGATLRFEIDHVDGAGADGIFGTFDDEITQLGGSGHDPWYVTDGGAGDLDGIINGSVMTNWYVNPDDSANERFLLTAQAVDAGADMQLGTGDDMLLDSKASHTFTDQVSANLDQWSNGAGPDADGTGNQNETWQNGNLGSTNAHYAEGESIAYRATLDDLKTGSVYSYTIQWDTVDSNAYAIDYLTGYNFTFEGSKHPLEPDPVPTQGITDLSSGLVSTVAIPVDPQLLIGFGNGVTDGLDSGQPSGAQFFTLFGAVTNVSTGSVIYTNSNQKASITITFTYTGGEDDNADSVVIAWGGHIADQDDWSDDLGETVQTASDISGSPYHMRHLSLFEDGVERNIGNQDRSASAAVVTNPDFTITKAVSSITSTDGATGTTVANAAGDIINYTITIDNTGDENLTGVTVTDQVEAGGITNAIRIGGDDGDNVLETNEIWTYSASYQVQQSDIDTNGGGDGDIDNVATGDTAQTDPPKTASEDVLIVQAPGLNIEKFVTDVGGDGAGGSVDSATDNITYRLVVTNTGNQTLTNVTVKDPLTGADFLIASLAVGGSQEFAGLVYDVQQSDIDTNGGGDGDIDNTATADSDQTGPDTASEDVLIVQAPGLNIEKFVTDVGGDGAGGSVDSATDNITYRLVVTNTGNQTLTNVTVKDPLTGADFLIASLAVGGSQEFAGLVYDVQQSDIDTNGGGDGDIDNTATADWTRPARIRPARMF